jgi:hypothetical protein
MSTLRTMTRASVDQAEALDFPEPSGATVTIHARYGDWPIDVTYRGKIDQLQAAIDRLAAAGLTPACPTAALAAPQRAKRSVEPIYQPDGTPCCPTHQKPLREGRYGLHCTAKDPEGKNGYCDLRFEV